MDRIQLRGAVDVVGARTSRRSAFCDHTPFATAIDGQLLGLVATPWPNTAPEAAPVVDGLPTVGLRSPCVAKSLPTVAPTIGTWRLPSEAKTVVATPRTAVLGT